jgi:uncharacterized protein YjbI with pentapeptide repeats
MIVWSIAKRIGWYLRSPRSAAFFRRAVGVVLFLAVLAGLLIAVQVVPEWQVRRASVRPAVANTEAKTTPADVAALQNEMRKTFIQVVGGAFALFALYLTWRRVKVAEQGHITDRYTKAVEQLGALTAQNKPNVEVRLGAIYALERIAQDSLRDHWTIMEVLTAYVRQNAPAPANKPTKKENEAAIAKGPATEIQAILTVLGRRRGRGREREGQQLDLSDSDLRGANFRGTHMEGANFFGAHLEGASFLGVHAEGAKFDFAHVEGATFNAAHVEGAKFDFAQAEEASFNAAQLEGAGFYQAHLERTWFLDANLKRAWFSEAHLERASFHGAQLDEAYFSGALPNGQRPLGAVGLTVGQFKGAQGWEQAYFDEAFFQALKSAWRRMNFSPEDDTREPETPPGA